MMQSSGGANLSGGDLRADAELERYVQRTYVPFEEVPLWEKEKETIVAQKVKPRVFIPEEKLPKSSKFRRGVFEANHRRICALAKTCVPIPETAIVPRKAQRVLLEPIPLAQLSQHKEESSLTSPATTIGKSPGANALAPPHKGGASDEPFNSAPLVFKKNKLRITPAAFRLAVEKSVPRNQIEALELLAIVLDGHYEQFNHDLDEEIVQRRLRMEHLAQSAKASKAKAEHLEYFLTRIKSGPQPGGMELDHGAAMRLLEGFMCAAASVGKGLPETTTGAQSGAKATSIAVAVPQPQQQAQALAPGTSIALGDTGIAGSQQLAIHQDDLRKLLDKRFPSDPMLASLAGSVFVARHRQPLLTFPELARRLHPLSKNVANVCSEVMALHRTMQQMK